MIEGKKKLPPLNIGGLEVPIPVIQAGMGVQVSKSELASAVANCGAIGCISSVGLGTLEKSMEDYFSDSREMLHSEIRKARELSPKGVIAVNVMGVLANYDEIIGVCVEEKVDMIISGAGLPLELPVLAQASPETKLVPVVSSARALKIILRRWVRAGRIPDAIIIEGPLCGGHMGFTYDEILNPEKIPITKILQDIKELIAPMEKEHNRKIPLIGAGAVADADDVLKMLDDGFDGVQVGTRFICTEESGIDQKSKEFYLDATEDDIIVIESPIGLPVKVLKSPLSEKIARGEKIKFKCPFRCLEYCKADKAHFCLADALVGTLFGDMDHGLFLTGSAIGRINDIIPVKKFFEPLQKML